VIVAVFGFAIFMAVDHFSYEKTSRGRTVGIIGFLGTASVLAGLGLKVLHLPAAFALLAVGAGLLLIYYVLSNAINHTETVT